VPRSSNNGAAAKDEQGLPNADSSFGAVEIGR
jgi:hypothetical protein